MRSLCILLAATAILLGCDTSIQPFQESGYHFSIGGVIDASVDTQFVRINPLRKVAEVTPEPYDAIVTTTNLTTGAESIWHDSVFTLVDGRYAHNFWSPIDFEPGGRYRFTARTATGAESTAEIVLPDSAEIVVQTIPFDPVATVNVFGAETLADLKLLYCGQRPGSGVERIDVSLIDRVSKFSLGYTVRIDPYALAREMGIQPVLWIRVVAIAAGPEWPDFENLDAESLALPHIHSNVDDGIGYLGAVASTTINWPGSTPVESACVHLLRRW